MFSIGQSSMSKAAFFNGAKFTNFVRGIANLGFLQPAEGSTAYVRRVGRGASSGRGKTSGRGHKGQKARGSVPVWMEGGQTPYFKRFPMTGFNRAHRKIYHELNLERIQTFWDNGRIPLKEGETLTIKVMRDSGLITGNLKDGVKILANGKNDYNVPLSVEASKASDSAIKIIEGLNQTFTSRYFTKLSLKAHVDPDYFLLRKGYVPIPARPTHKRDIKYYSNPDKRGYLLNDRSLLLDHMGRPTHARVVKKSKTTFKDLLDAASTSRIESTQKRVRLADL
ncbi:ribosomal protein L15/L10-like protein [Spathaspora passalidarum NRRL Y-27907]|uniref:Ribosomal protein L15/L10-like protein n=1 Tax=Spathaspora passalidarum (strain NRRL Y-27907 / 11-Y1) TaxID=619300 RepID=G3ALX9_SPAPN|nr:ribosomal protein L15/L10-like protein [Spathaspora passalidarum NRRL Y-27907]EGW33332.1 ribosomal protein L15/L10-like protein [Spathaspora passalidarum NRRL Y-27907]